MKHASSSADKRVLARWILSLFIFSFMVGMLLTYSLCAAPDLIILRWQQDKEPHVVSEDCVTRMAAKICMENIRPPCSMEGYDNLSDHAMHYKYFLEEVSCTIEEGFSHG